jgi:hypothetical protein
VISPNGQLMRLLINRGFDATTNTTIGTGGFNGRIHNLDKNNRAWGLSRIDLILAIAVMRDHKPPQAPTGIAEH